ncbi:MAG: hypothetical protein A3I32_00605 [Candidatus Yanofskybacteria bacterium RIFCSPLOWO2_02_FULL_45_10]|uniref:Methyltransferase type 11 domain-containing protein n=3 Tax=Patescibacteria group TaxID=1783273 RepID=A0A1F8G2J0_9BACT|nr:MAG: Methyltransferase type 11 [Candidatus Daviesbacteria bacterium GW2011_GWB1_41_5]OGN19554.1 MAG: hypothetical protein A3F25_00420 [Candidatus Yanofskybacteria bacterium RIFCSPHIGHO2_12_FULL_45_19b]OGN32477.1 MAG: hypothetical protein A3I32_00605 [Candidatus Yanofskybacteria bacterium RIFCSPLOWO2_02_FULL_45_10]
MKTVLTRTTKEVRPANPVNTKLGQCYFCSSENLVILRNRLRHGIHKNILKCEACGLIYAQSKENPVPFYRKKYRQKHGPILGKTLSSQELFEFNSPLQAPRIKQLSKLLKPSARVLDIGSSTGHFLYAIKDKVKEVVGVELNLANAEFTRRELGIKVYDEPIEKLALSDEYFDLITVYHTFEHVVDPLLFLKIVRRYLKPNGHLFIEVPNTDDALMSIYQLKKFADFWFIEPHLFYYNPETLKKVLARGGFEGRISTTQAFSLYNHLNWLYTGQPQADWLTATTIPRLPSGGSHAELKGEINKLLEKTDKQYRNLLNKNQVGSMLTFLGTKSKS